ncbi:MAG: helix-turn-helix domain-containing protein [Paracoccaceae bacterium]
MTTLTIAPAASNDKTNRALGTIVVFSKPAQPRKSDSANLQELFESAAFEQHFKPESTIILHGDQASAIYLVVSGTIRCCTIDPDGGRQIFSFAKSGDYVGISDIDTSHFTAEAVDHVIVRSLSRTVVEQALAVNSALRKDVRSRMHNLLVQREKQLFSLISQKAPERLLAFLHDFAASRGTSGFIVLPMSRQDIGDHLGMTMETASRAFGALKARGAIEMTTADKYRLVV